MKERKTYSAPGKLVVTINIDGKNKDILFNGVDVNHHKRIFTTTDPVIQEKLESLPSFGSFYELTRVIQLKPEEESVTAKTEEVVQEETPEVTSEAPGLNKVLSEEEQPQMTSAEDGKVLEKKEFEVLADAKKFLRDLGVEVRRNMNTEQVAEIFRDKGFDLVIKK